MRGLVVFLLGLAVALPVQADCDRRNESPRTYYLTAGVQEAVAYPTPVRRIAVGDDTIADVEVLDEQEILVDPRSAGATSLLVWTRCSSAPDRRLLMVDDGVTAEVLETLPDPDTEARLPAQVQTDIRVVEVSRDKLNEVGSQFFVGGSTSRFGGSSPDVFSEIGIGADDGALGGGIRVGDGFSLALGEGRSALAVIEALERSGFAYTMAEPSLVAMSGQEATFLAGGEFPVPVQEGVGDRVSIQFREFGVRLSLTPTILDEGRIALKVAPEVSELDFSSGVETGGVAVPGLRVRRTDTAVSLGDGESFIISGLISSDTRSQVNSLPGLASVPILGAFFRSSELETRDRELIMVVTPRLVQPIAAGAELPAMPGEEYRLYRPGFYEFLLHEDGSFERARHRSRGGYSQ